ncbi:MAG: putative PIN and TRAM-domain containing protein precursor [Syntrophorhabdaceae bacterium PtaU1.Bin034]|nr:MAG: putative PIN and TRAM-domain containing protein precursor [Syntrophorhabdaceae bacterium PtaU1.Bin034]
MTIIAQLVLITVTAVTGYFIVREITPVPLYALIGAVLGLTVGYLVIKVEEKLKEIPLKIIIGTLIGITIGLFITNLFISKLLLTHAKDVPITLPIYILLYFIMGYLGFRIGEKKSHTIDLSKFPLLGKSEATEGNKILDTSAIIDGRIADLCETGFVEGTFVIPQFVLYEIQHIADLQDPVRKTRGRRGLDILHRLQKQTQVKVKIVDVDFPKLKDVDSKLIALAKSLQGKVVTNDYNLNKVAELQGISVLNLNELATALRPAILPGEQLSIKIVKEGKEYGQGIGYLDDGTMVVVDDARKLLGKTVDVIVTSLLQTTSGRMIFAKLKEQAEKEFYFPEEYSYEEHVR